MSPSPSALALLCEAAARALRGTATVTLHDGSAPRTWGAAVHGDSALRLTAADDGRATLSVERPAWAEPWSDDDRALAAVFARLAGAAAVEAHAPADAPVRPGGPGEAHFRRLVESGTDLLMTAAPDLGVTYVSPSVERLLGYRPEEMVGRVPADLLHPDDVPVLFGVLGEALADPEPIRELTWRIRHRDGGWRVMEALTRMLAPGDPAAGFLVNARDVTERRAVEEALRQSEERYRAVVESLNEVVFHSDGQGRWTFLNGAWGEVTGMSVEESLGRSFLDFAHPDDLPHCYQSYQLLLRGEREAVRHDVRFRHRGGGWRQIEVFVRAARDAEGALVGTTGTFNDVTERREAEAALRASEERFRALVEQLPAIIYTASLAEGNPTLFVSPQVGRLLGFDEAEWLARPRPWLERIHPDDRERVERDWDAAHAAGRRFAAEYRMVARDGRVLWFRDEAEVLRDGAGRPLHIQGVMLDVSERKAAEQALRESEEHFRALIENGNDLLMISAPDLSLTYVSPSVERLLGYAPEEMIGFKPADVLHPDDLPPVYEGMQAIFDVPGTVRRISWRIRHRDGSWRHFEALGRTIDPHWAARGAVCNARDVTEQRAAEAALQESEQHFRALIEHSSDLVQVLDPAGRVVYTGPSVQRLLGYTPDEIMGGGLADFMHPDDLPAAAELVGRLLAAPGSSGSLEYRVRHTDGSWRWLEASARTLSPTTAEQGIVANARDVTERREAQEALRESEAKYRSVVDAAQDMITVIDADGVVRFQSPSAERTLGFTPAEMVGRNVMDFLHPDDVPMAVARLSKVMTHPGTVESVQYRSLCKDGSYRHVESTGRTVLPDSAAAGAVGIVRDITARIEAEAALRQAKADAERAHEEAERANRAKSEFLSRMSHELRTPLNSILGFAQVLEDVELPPEYRTGVRHILNGGRHLLDLINEVLDIARIEAGQQAMSLEPVRVQAVVREAIDMVRPLALSRGVRIADAAGDAGDPYVRADRQRLTQVLLNLLSNAVKYNRAGGEVRVDAEVVRGDAHGGRDAPERVRVRVRDEGAGLTPEQQEQLFVPFARLGAERTGVEGTGLGLALSQRLAHAMGGALFLERSGPDGSVFSAELAAAANPLDRAPALAIASGPADRAGCAPATLLYVEDNLANLTLVETVLLPRPEWRVIPALQGRLGLELAAEHAPDVVLLDLHLPDMHGAEVLRRLRADPRTAAIPVVVISADATPRTVDALTAGGADAFLTKPLDVRLFVQTLERLLARAPRVA